MLPCSIRHLQTELSLVCEERDKVTQELKRTPELIEKALADLKEQCEHLHNSHHFIKIHELFIFRVSVFRQCMCLSLPFDVSSDESKLGQQQQEIQQSWVEVQQAAAERKEAQQSLQQIQAQLDESKVNLDRLQSELISQQEHSAQGEAAVT